jgi:hypothetical protein
MRLLSTHALLLIAFFIAMLLSNCAGETSKQDSSLDGDQPTEDADIDPKEDGDSEKTDVDSDMVDTERQESPIDGDLDKEREQEADGGDGDLTDSERDDDLDLESDLDVEFEPESETVCWSEPLDCSGTSPFDYTCTMGQAETCPGGICVLGLCIGPVFDQDRWADCNDGCCTPCEGDGRCPADCSDWPDFTGEKEFYNDSTLTIWVHGWSNTSPNEAIYGQERGCGGILEDMRAYGVDRPCTDEPDGQNSPRQMAKFEYFGDTPAEWLSAQQIEEIEQFPLGGADTLHRYALITAIYIRRKLDQTGATHVNLACHSYGCLISRYMMEHNLKGLAGENRFVRWFTSAGVLAGARLARLYDNPNVRDVADLFGISQGDFVVMNPDFVMDNVAVWDHQLHAANSPYLANMLIHHSCGDDPRIQQALGITLLDFNNPGDEPNDGIMFTLDTYFHEQDNRNRFVALNGETLLPTRSYVYTDHMAVPETDSSIALAAAALFHKRKVFITLKAVTLKDDFENPLGLDVPPAELIIEHQVRYNPYLQETFGRNVLISNNRYDYRTPEMFGMDVGQTSTHERLVFSGPVFDEMDSLWLNVDLLEVDWYPRFGVRELIAGIGDKHDSLISFTGQVPLTDHEFAVENANARILVGVKVVDLYQTEITH